MSGGGRVLLIVPDRLGDSILASGLVAALAERHGARMVVAGGAAARDLFERHPLVDAYWVMKKAPRAGHWRALWARARGERWAAVCDLRGSLTGYALRRGAFYRHDKRRAATGDHVVEAHSAVIGGGPYAPDLTGLAWPEPPAWIAEALNGARAVAIGPTAGWPWKIWPAARWAEVQAGLKARLGENVPFVLLGAPGEEAVTAPLAEALGEAGLDATGRLGVAETGAVIRACGVFAGNDSGLMHLAAASGAKVLGLFGHTRPEEYGPWSRRARTVVAPSAEQGRVRKAITPPEALALISEIRPEAVTEALAGLIEDPEI
ncbi:MAG: glycosyltransferase family 9 protein [Oceanicaulis sp.]